MCGVIGLIYEKERGDLGRIAAELLKTLEYRGYDSTGAAIQGAETGVRLVKGVGAPSVMVNELGIVDMGGKIFCGQVRWATFGAVDQANAQPHSVTCKTAIYGAHNGNVTNCDDLKAWLLSEGHAVLSDNDGEMVVHTIEHYFARELAARDGKEHTIRDVRLACMRAAIISAAEKLKGSYAAVVVDPVSRSCWAIKQGSSLYFGIGRDPKSGRFAIASSDLSSVLKLTRVLVPLSEGEVVEYDEGGHHIRRVTKRDGLAPGDRVERSPVRSRLRAKDTALLPPFETFMEQEISAQEQTCRNVVTSFLGGAEESKALRPILQAQPAEDVRAISQRLDELRDLYDDEEIRRGFHTLADLPAFRGLLRALPRDLPMSASDLVSSEAGFLADLVPMARDGDDLLAIRIADVMIEHAETDELQQAIGAFLDLCTATLDRRGRVFIVACGTSHHAAKAGAIFFNEVAEAEIVPVLPGEFRAQYARSLRDEDLIVAVSQSGETKDVIDVLNQVIASGRPVRRVAIVNNVSSTLAQEKCELVIPLRCGPEIAVPATKSFMNQMAIFYCLAVKLGERRGTRVTARLEKLPQLPALIRETFDSTRTAVDLAARHLFLAPSVHILATRITPIADEGALKIREVVLNHTEGYEGSEFKHGPNTILGFNTLFGPREVDALLKKIGEAAGRMGRDVSARLIQAIAETLFSEAKTPFTLSNEERAVLDAAVDRPSLFSSLYADYPLIYVTGPDEQDVNLTISQINTHKIRGSSTIVLAEDHAGLHQAATKPPADNPAYRSAFVSLPRTNDTLMTMFSATVVLQRLALQMSLLKMEYLNGLGIAEHGVHPDVPKNVSKSITVD